MSIGVTARRDAAGAGSTGQPDGGKLRVFISYSREDLSFADQVEAALRLTGYAPTIDRHGITGGDDWKRRLGALIRDADTVAFVLSPASARSEICAWEVDEAVRLGKRIVPLVCRPLAEVRPPEALGQRNYIFFYEEPKSPGSGFGTGLMRLVEALNTDLDWLRLHTRFLQRATEWDEGGRTADRLLSGSDIDLAKDWLAARPATAPEATALQLAFFRASEEEATRRASTERQRLEEMARAQAARETALRQAETALKLAEEAQRRRARVSRALVTVSVLAALVSGGLGYWVSERNTQLQRQVGETEKAVEVAKSEAAAARAAKEAAEAEKRRAETQQKLAETAEKQAQDERDAAEGARKVAEAAQKRAEEARREQVLALATRHLDDGRRPPQSPTDAALIALEALPDEKSAVKAIRERALWPPAEAALEHAMRAIAERQVLAGHTKRVHGVAASRNGRWLASSSQDDTVRVYAWEGGQWTTHHVLKGESKERQTLTEIAITPDGAHLVAGGTDNDVRVWSLADGRRVHLLTGHDSDTWVVATSSDSRLVATGSNDKSIRIWRLADGGLERAIKANEIEEEAGSVIAITFADADRLVVTGSSDNILRIWDVATGKRLARLEGHSAGILSVAAVRTDDGLRIVSGAEDKTVRIWDATDPANAREVRLINTADKVNGVAVTPDGTHFAAALDNGTVHVWQLASGRETRVLHGHSGPAVGVAFTSDGRQVVSVSADGTMRIWERESESDASVLMQSKDGKGQIAALALARDGSLLVASFDRNLVIGDPGARSEFKTVASPEDVRALAISRDGQLVVAGSESGRVHTLGRDGTWKPKFDDEHRSRITAVAISDDGRHIASGSFDDTIRLRSADTQGGSRHALKHVLTLHTDTVTSLAFSPDGRFLASGADDNTIRIWDVEKGSQVRIIDEHSGSVTGLVWTRTGRLVSASRDGTIRVWDTETWQARRPGTMRASPPSPVVTLVGSEDGRRLVSGYADGSVRIWSVETAYEMRHVKIGARPITAIAVSGDLRLVIAGEDEGDERVPGGRVQRIDLLPRGQELVERAQARVPRCLLPSQRAEFNPEGDVPAWCKALGKWPFNADGAVTKGIELLAEGNHADAEAIFKTQAGDAATMVRIAEARAEVAFERGKSVLQRGNRDADAEAELAQAIALSPQLGPRVAALWGETLLARAKRILDKSEPNEAEAQALLVRAVERNPSSATEVAAIWARFYLERAKKLLDEDKEEAAMAALAVARQRTTDPAILNDINEAVAEHRLDKARKQITAGNEIASRALLDQLFKDRPDLETKINKAVAEAHFERGKQLFEDGDEAGAELAFAAGLRLDADGEGKVREARTAAWLTRGVAHLKAGRASEAEADFARVVAARDDAAETIVRALQSAGREAFDAAPRERGEARTTAMRAALVLEEAGVTWARRDGVDPKARASIIFNASRTRYEIDDLAGALAGFEEAERLGEEDATAWVFVTRLRRVRVEKEEKAPEAAVVDAVSVYLDLSATARRRLTPQRMMSNAMRIAYPLGILHGRERIARSDGRETACDTQAAHPFDALRLADGIKFERLGEEALKACDAEIAVSPGEPRLRFQRARVLSALGDKAKKEEAGGAAAEALYKRMVADLEGAAEKGYPMAFNNLASAYEAGNGVDASRARSEELYLELMNRAIYCCVVGVARRLMTQEDQLGAERVRRVVGALLAWAADLGNAEAGRMLDAEVAAGRLTAPGSRTRGTFTSRPPWM